MNRTSDQNLVLGGARRVWVLACVGAALLLAGSVFAADWINLYLHTSVLYPAIGKPGITIIAMIIVLIAGKHAFEKKDWILLFLAFCCMLPTDILMSIVVVSPSLSVGSSSFMVGGVLSIIAHIFLIIRVSRGGAYFKDFKVRDLWLPAVIYGSAVIVVIVLWADIVRVGHAAIAPAYTAFFCTTVWFSWETVRRKLYPKPNAWMVAIAATCWYATEILGEIYNLGLGKVSSIVFCLVWVFYGTNVILWGLSAYRWTKSTD